MLLNAAAALIVAGKAKDLRHGVELAAKSIASGAAKRALAQLVAITNRARRRMSDVLARICDGKRGEIARAKAATASRRDGAGR